MYPNLKAELARRDITVAELAERTGINYQTLAKKISGKAPIAINEARIIRDAIDKELTVDYLFQEAA